MRSIILPLRVQLDTTATAGDRRRTERRIYPAGLCELWGLLPDKSGAPVVVSRSSLLLLLTLAIASQTLAQPQQSAPKLVGTVNLPGLKHALLELRTSSLGRVRTNTLILAEGEREGQLAMQAIHPENGTVELLVNGSNLVVSLEHASSQGGVASTMVLENVDLNAVLAVYSRLIHRSLLRHSLLPSAHISSHTSASSQAEAAAELERALLAQGIVAIPDGKKFMMVLPKSLASIARPRSAELKPLPGRASLNDTNNPAANREPSFAPGEITFVGATLQQVATIYAELVGRKIDKREQFPSGPCVLVSFKSETPLTVPEAIYALETTLLWGGVKFMPEGNDLLQPEAVSVAEPPK